MTRREFIRKLIKTGSVIVVGVCRLGRKVAPRKFVRAVRLKEYPGLLRPLQNIHKQSKWSG